MSAMSEMRLLLRPVQAASHVQQRHGVAQAAKQARGQNLPIEQLQQTTAEHQQIPDQIATVHHGDVLWRQRLEGMRVIPVEEVAAVTIQASQSAKGLLGSVEQATNTAIPEVVSGQVRQEGHPDVGRARARGDGWGRLLLKIVGRQPILFGADKGLEEPPRPPG